MKPLYFYVKVSHNDKRLYIEHRQSRQLTTKWLVYNYYFLGEITHQCGQCGHLVTSNNTIMNINSKQITEYSISTTRSILSIPFIHIFQGNHIAVHTFDTLG